MLAYSGLPNLDAGPNYGRTGLVYRGRSAAFGDLRFGLALVVYHRTVMVWAMNVKGTLRWTAFSTRFWVSPTPVMFFPSWKQTSMEIEQANKLSDPRCQRH